MKHHVTNLNSCHQLLRFKSSVRVNQAFSLEACVLRINLTFKLRMVVHEAVTYPHMNNLQVLLDLNKTRHQNQEAVLGVLKASFVHDHAVKTIFLRARHIDYYINISN